VTPGERTPVKPRSAQPAKGVEGRRVGVISSPEPKHSRFSPTPASPQGLSGHLAPLAPSLSLGHERPLEAADLRWG
jgi:hypothetical protein